VYSG
jgi:hypothetical protein